MENIRKFPVYRKTSASVWIGTTSIVKGMHTHECIHRKMERKTSHGKRELQEAAWKKEKPEVMNH